MKYNKSRIKRLFLFAGYDRDGVIDAAEMMYIRALAAHGDVIFVMDSDVKKSELKKVADIPNVIYAAAARHGEYDFGSYKRAYISARDAGILKKYDFVYMVNDSVYAPLYDLAGTLEKMEHMNMDAFGPVIHPYSRGEYIQSWFIGMRQSVFLSQWFDDFMTAIKPQPDKGTIIYLYEHGFSERVAQNGLTFGGVYSCRGRAVYNRVKYLYRRGLPFMKRNAFNRRHGALGRQLVYILNHVPNDVRDAILDNARRTWGDEHINWVLTRNPFKIMYRHIKHAAYKVFIEGI